MRSSVREPYSYRLDPAVTAFPDDKPIIIFDGYCVLCSGWARFVLRHDRAKRYRLLSAQSPLGRSLYLHFGLSPDDYESNILLQDGRAWFKSEGSIRMGEGLGPPWSWVASAFRLLPHRARDGLYDFIALRRYDYFGRRDTCYLPPPGDRDRFIE